MTPVLGAVQLSVGTEKPVPGDALTQQRDEREGQQPSGCTGLRLPEDADDGEYGRIQCQEERIGQTSPSADAVGHLDIRPILFQYCGAKVWIRRVVR